MFIMKSKKIHFTIAFILALQLLFTGLMLNGARPVYAASGPVNPNETKEAKELLAFLYSIQGKGMLTGQHEYIEAPDVYAESIKTLTGKYPAVHGYELGGITGQSDTLLAAQRQNVTNSAINWSKNGGIVTMMYHASYPGACQCWNQVQRTTTQAEFDKIVTPGTTEYNALISDLDKVAVFLKQMKDANIPILWRPYHEMNGDWFWWGQKNNYVKLWDIMYDRFVNYYHLDNLLWVWNANAPYDSASTYASTYPGSNKVDILAADIYNYDYKQSHQDGLVALGGGKPIAIGENGELPNMSTVSTTQNKWVWQMTWGKMLNDNNSNLSIQDFFNHTYAITRDEVKIDPIIDPTVTTQTYSENLALRKTAVASSTSFGDTASKAVDSDAVTRWQSGYSDKEWIYVDLGKNYNINTISVQYLYHRARNYEVQVSTDAINWTTIKSVVNGLGTLDEFKYLQSQGRYVKLNMTLRSSPTYVYNVQEIKVFGTNIN
jgi:mannan endo-1,4-beta-mannosidase